MTLRTALRQALGDDVRTLTEVVEAAIYGASTPAERYPLIAPDYADRKEFVPFWRPGSPPSARTTARKYVRRRLQFDAILELGVQSRTGRTLELTAAVAVETDAGSPTRMLTVAGKAWESAQHRTMLGEAAPAPEQLLQWVRGTVERVRLQGGIYHDWLKNYIAKDGRRWQIWGGRPKGQGMPAFPAGRSAPTFPRIGKADATAENFDSVTSTAS